MMAPRFLLLVIAAAFFFFALSLSEKHIAKIFDYQKMPEALRKSKARMMRLTSLGISMLIAGLATGRSFIIVIGVVVIVVARSFSQPRAK